MREEPIKVSVGSEGNFGIRPLSVWIKGKKFGEFTRVSTSETMFGDCFYPNFVT